MNDKQFARYASLAKSDDFLDDNATQVAIITQIPPLATRLKAQLKHITNAEGIGSQDNRGERINKDNLRKDLTAKFFKIARAATAYYLSINDPIKQKIVDFNESEVDKMKADKLYSTAKKLASDTAADVANLIGADSTDHDALNTAADAFNNVIPNTKRATERSKVYNAQLDPLINEGREIQKKIDIYMQTLIATNEVFYNEWRETLNIDDNPTANPPILSLTISITAEGYTTADYSSIGLQGSSEIKLKNENDAPVQYGFSRDGISFMGTPTEVAAKGSQRKTATALGYHSVDAQQLTLYNPNTDALSVTLEFFDMD